MPSTAPSKSAARGREGPNASPPAAHSSHGDGGVRGKPSPGAIASSALSALAEPAPQRQVPLDGLPEMSPEKLAASLSVLGLNLYESTGAGPSRRVPVNEGEQGYSDDDYQNDEGDDWYEDDYDDEEEWAEDSEHDDDQWLDVPPLIPYNPREEREWIEQYRLEGNSHYNNKCYVSALDSYTRALVLDPTNAKIFSNRSSALFKLGRLNEAALDARRSIARDPTWCKGYYRLACALAAMGQYDEAAESMQHALSFSASERDTIDMQRLVKEYTKRIVRIKADKKAAAAASSSAAPAPEKGKSGKGKDSAAQAGAAAAAAPTSSATDSTPAAAPPNAPKAQTKRIGTPASDATPTTAPSTSSMKEERARLLVSDLNKAIKSKDNDRMALILKHLQDEKLPVSKFPVILPEHEVNALKLLNMGFQTFSTADKNVLAHNFMRLGFVQASVRALELGLGTIDSVDKHGDTPLHIAVANEDTAGVLALLRFLTMQSLHIKNSSGVTARNAILASKKARSTLSTIEKTLQEREANEQELKKQAAAAAAATSKAKKEKALELDDAEEDLKKLTQAARVKRIEQLLSTLSGKPVDAPLPFEVRGQPAEKARDAPGAPQSLPSLTKFDRGINDQLVRNADLENAPWTVMMPRCVWQLHMKMHVGLRQPIISTLTRLAAGQWNAQQDRLLDPLDEHFKGVRLYRTPVVQDVDLIWEVLVRYLPDRHAYSDTIVAWGIAPSDPSYLENHLAWAAHTIGRRSPLARSMKLSTLASYDLSSSLTVFTPRVYKPSDFVDGSLPDTIKVYYPIGDGRYAHPRMLPMYNVDKAFVRSFLEGLVNVDFPICLSEDADVFPTGGDSSAIILLGRSGTGKTTVTIEHMWREYCQHWSPVGSRIERVSRSGARGPLHQVFITANPILRSEVRKSFRSLQRGAGFKVPKDDSHAITDLRYVPDAAFPLFLTAREWLLLVDGTLTKPFFTAAERTASAHSNTWHEERRMLFEIPDLEVDGGDDDAEEAGADGAQGAAGAQAGGGARPRREVNYSYFADVMWPRLNSAGQYPYHPSLVFTEIFSFIKGSAESMELPQGRLRLADYTQMGKKRSPNFAGNRDLIYEIYLKYEKLKTELHCFDIMDAVFYIYRQLKESETGYVGVPVHAMYHDEVQDFTQAELMLGFLVSSDINGIFCSGDTSQTIARGISFRFADLRSLFHLQQDIQKVVVAKHRHQLPPFSVPKICNLTINYRTHSRILQAASSVVDMLHAHFPYAVDKMEPDVGCFDGPIPVLFETNSPSELALLMHGDNLAAEGVTVELDMGAQQVVIVRSHEAKLRLPDDLRSALVLTVFECKGLEFDDVFLYNFFSDSPAGNEWRVVTSYLEKEKSRLVRQGMTPLRTSQRQHARPLKFDERAHALLGEELKQLYTAMTRARRRLFFFDENEEKRLPMFDFFHRTQLANVVSSAVLRGSSVQVDVLGLILPSSRDEWAARGDMLFENGVFSVAAECYRKSGDRESLRVASAFASAMAAKRLPAGQERRDLFLAAADGFLRSQRYADASRCLYSAGQYTSAAELFMMLELPLEVARCFEKSGDRLQAAEYFVKAGKINRALQLYRDMGHHHRCLPLIDKHPDLKLTAAVRNAYAMRAALYFHKAGNVEGLQDAITHADDLDSITAFLQKYKYNEHLAAVLNSRGRVTEAAMLLVESGRYADAGLLLQSKGGFDATVLRYFERNAESSDGAEAELYFSKALDAVRALGAKGEYDAARLKIFIAAAAAERDQDMPKLRKEATAFFSQRQSAFGMAAVELLNIQADDAALVGKHALQALARSRDAAKLLRALIHYASIPPSRIDDSQITDEAEKYCGLLVQTTRASAVRLMDKLNVRMLRMKAAGEESLLSKARDSDKLLISLDVGVKLMGRSLMLTVDELVHAVLSGLSKQTPLADVVQAASAALYAQYIHTSFVPYYQTPSDVAQPSNDAQTAAALDRLVAQPGAMPLPASVRHALSVRALSAWLSPATETHAQTYSDIVAVRRRLAHANEMWRLPALLHRQGRQFGILPAQLPPVQVRTLRPKPTVVVRRHRAGFVRVRASPQRTAAEILFRRRVGLGSDSEDSDEEYDIHAPDADPLSYLETLIEDPNAPDEYDVTYEYPPARVEPALPSGLFWHGRRAVTVHHLLQYPRWRGDAPVTVAQALSAAAHRAAADGSAAAIPLLRVAATTLLCYISNMNDVYLPQSLLDLTREFDVAPPPSLVVGAMARQDSLMQVLRALVDAFVRVGATVRSGEWRAPLIALTAVLLVNHFVNDLFDAEQATSLRAILVHVGSVPQRAFSNVTRFTDALPQLPSAEPLGHVAVSGGRYVLQKAGAVLKMPHFAPLEGKLPKPEITASPSLPPVEPEEASHLLHCVLYMQHRFRNRRRRRAVAVIERLVRRWLARRASARQQALAVLGDGQPSLLERRVLFLLVPGDARACEYCKVSLNETTYSQHFSTMSHALKAMNAKTYAEAYLYSVSPTLEALDQVSEMIKEAALIGEAEAPQSVKLLNDVSASRSAIWEQVEAVERDPKANWTFTDELQKQINAASQLLAKAERWIDDMRALAARKAAPVTDDREVTEVIEDVGWSLKRAGTASQQRRRRRQRRAESATAKVADAAAAFAAAAAGGANQPAK